MCLAVDLPWKVRELPEEIGREFHHECNFPTLHRRPVNYGSVLFVNTVRMIET